MTHLFCRLEDLLFQPKTHFFKDLSPSSVENLYLLVFHLFYSKLLTVLKSGLVTEGSESSRSAFVVTNHEGGRVVLIPYLEAWSLTACLGPDEFVNC